MAFQDIPAVDYTLSKNGIYTFVIRISGGLTNPSSSSVLAVMRNNIDKSKSATTTQVSSAFGSPQYNIVVRMNRDMSWEQMDNMIKNGIKYDLGYDVEDIDFVSGAAPMPSFISSITQPLANVAEKATGTVSSLKRIVVAGAVVAGFIYLGPFIKHILPKDKKK